MKFLEILEIPQKHLRFVEIPWESIKIQPKTFEIADYCWSLTTQPLDKLEYQENRKYLAKAYWPSNCTGYYHFTLKTEKHEPTWAVVRQVEISGVKDWIQHGLKQQEVTLQIKKKGFYCGGKGRVHHQASVISTSINQQINQLINQSINF